MGLLQLVELIAEEARPFRPGALVRVETRPLTLRLGQGEESCLVLAAGHPGMAVEQCQMRLRIEQADVLVLSRDVEESPRGLGELRCDIARVVSLAPRLAPGRENEKPDSPGFSGEILTS